MSEHIQVRNIRKVAVNARLTLVVWALECMANVCIVIFIVFIYGKTNVTTLTIELLWYYLILPYMYMMNTSFNKERIIDDGWKTVIQNSLPKHFQIILRQRRSVVGPMYAGQLLTMQGNHIIKQKHLLNDKFKKETVSTLTNQKSNAGGNSCSELQSSVYIIPMPSCSVYSTGKHPICKQKNSKHLPNTAKQHSSIQGPKTNLNHLQRSNSESETDSYADVKSNIDIRFEMRQEILSRMLLHINDENIYLHYFRQLVELDHAFKGCPNMTPDLFENFEIIPFESDNPSKIGKVKRSNQLDSLKIVPLQNARKTKCKNTTAERTHFTHFRFSVNISDRTKMRRELLEEFNFECNNDNVYDDFFNRLVDVEENLIKEED